MKRQRGAALLAVFAVLLAVTAVAAASTVRLAATPYARDDAERRALVLAREALWGHAQAQHCVDPLRPIETLLACPDSVAAEGVAAPACPGISRGWLPWRTLELPPLRDRSGACLWIERNGATVRIIAPGAAAAGQSRATDPSRLVCGGNVNPANYVDATDPALTLTLEGGALAAVCP